jgi:hypothetical protein
LTGTVATTNWTSTMLAERRPIYTGTNRSPQTGRYTMVLPAPGQDQGGPKGDGFGSVTVSRSGYATLGATLGDSTAVAQTAPISRSGHWPLYVSLYGGKGSILSWINFTNQPANDVLGLMSWIRPPIVRSRYYSNGFSAETVFTGSAYVPPATRTNRVLEMPQALVGFEGGNLPAPFANDVLLEPGSRIVNRSSNRLAMSIALATGRFSGSAVDPHTGKILTFRGALLQKGHFGSGLFLGTNQTGRVFVGP